MSNTAFTPREEIAYELIRVHTQKIEEGFPLDVTTATLDLATVLSIDFADPATDADFETFMLKAASRFEKEKAGA